LEELRQQARATLLQGARDGSLQDALKSTKDEAWKSLKSLWLVLTKKTGKSQQQKKWKVAVFVQ